jgi:uncharacterized protein YkwD
MNFNLLKTSAFVKCASIAALVLAFAGCSEDSGTNVTVIKDESKAPSLDDILQSSNSKIRSSSAFVVQPPLSSSSWLYDDFRRSSSARRPLSSAARPASSASVLSSSAKTPASSSVVALSSAKAVSSSAKVPASSAAVQSSSVAAPKSSAVTPASSATVQSSSAAAPKSSATAPASSAAQSGFFSENWRQACLDKINEYRATENLAPLTLAPEAKQTCTDNQAAADMEANKAHGHFGDCGEWAQNSGPNFNTSWRKTAIEVSDAYLKMMWEDEKALVTSGERDPKKDEDYPYIGHYLNMKGNYKTVACGIALTADGKKGWFNVNFF